MSEGGGGELLELEGVSRRFGEVAAVDGLTLSLRRGEFVTLLGPSGCGKTTALRMIAGFETADAGRIRFEGEEIGGWSPQRRGFGMVFQNYALFPHLDVFENVGFGLRARRVEEPRLRERVEAALRIVDLAGYGGRAVQALSGGQQQRVALARALAVEPPLLLLDEPLSNLDQALRVRTRLELRDLVKSLGITALFVTHDQEEAFDLSDRIAVMKSGRLRQIATPAELYDAPADPFVAGFVGRASALPVYLESERVRLPSGPTWPREGFRWGGTSGAPKEGPATFLFRPEALDFVPPSSGPPDGIPLHGVVRAVRFRGAVSLYQVEISGAVNSAGQAGAPWLLDVEGAPGRVSTGDSVALEPRPGARLHLFPSGAGE